VCFIGFVAEAEVVGPASAGRVVVVVGGPIAAGVSTTRSRMPATAAEAITTESAVAPSHAAPMLKYRFIHPSMPYSIVDWVKARLTDDETTAASRFFRRSRCKFPQWHRFS